VARDSTFRPIFLNDTLFTVPPTATEFRFNVTGVDYGSTSFTVTAGGKDLVVPVQVAPINQVSGTFDNPTPALGDTVTLTLPAGTTFTPTAKLQITGFADSLNPLIVARDPAGTFVRFLAPPNVNAPITVTEVLSPGAPGVTLRPETIERLNTPLIDTVDVTLSTSAPTLGQAVTMTVVNPLIRIRPDVATGGPTLAGITFPGLLPGPGRGVDTLHLRSGGAPQNVTVAADSSSATFDAPPNANGVATVVSFVFPGGFSLPLPTRQIMTSPNIGTTLNATFDNNAPAVLDPVVITAPAGFKFASLAEDTVTIGGRQAILQSVAPDGSTLTVVPVPAGTTSNGPAEIKGVVPIAAPQFSLTLPTVQTVAIGVLTPLTGTDDPATAPSITVPGTLVDVGTFGFTSDAGFGFQAQVYALHIPAPVTYQVTLTGVGSPADLGLYITTAADPTTAVLACDNAGRAAPPESCSINFPAGDFILQIVTFGPGYPENDPDPNFIQLKFQ
jgi:hypothetical protein